jgi:hypothetical protein
MTAFLHRAISTTTHLSRKDMKRLSLILVAAALVGCSMKQYTSAPAAKRAPAAESMPTALVDLPKECSDYVERVTACVSKQHSATTDAMKTSLDQIKAIWNSMGPERATIGPACKTANDEFAGPAAELGC